MLYYAYCCHHFHGCWLNQFLQLNCRFLATVGLWETGIVAQLLKLAADQYAVMLEEAEGLNLYIKANLNYILITTAPTQ